MRNSLITTIAAVAALTFAPLAPTSALAADDTRPVASVDAAKHRLDRAVSTVKKYHARVGKLPNRAVGNALIGSPFGSRYVTYLTDGRGYCVLSSSETPPRMWLYDSATRRAYVARSWAKVRTEGGACLRLLKAEQARESAAAQLLDAARGTGLAIEVAATDTGEYPATLDTAGVQALGFTYPKGFTLGWYVLIPGKTTPLSGSFLLCVQRTGGGYAVYSSANGGITDHASTGTCPPLM